MRNLLGCLAVVAIPFAPTKAHSQAAQARFAASGGVAKPLSGAPGDAGAQGGSGFADGWKPGPSLRFDAGKSLSTNIALQLGLELNRFTLDEENYLGSGGGSVSGGTLSTVGIGAELLYFPVAGATATPYLLVGLSALRLSDVSVSSQTASGTQDVTLDRTGFFQDVGAAVGAGVEIGAKPTRFFLEARGVFGLYDQVSFASVRAGFVVRR